MQPTKPIDIITLDSAQSVDEDVICGREEPVVIRGFNLGDCLTKWTPEYLRAKGSDKLVKVHRSPYKRLDFRRKNFAYETVTFSDLVKHCSEGSESKDYWYLRSLGEDPRGKDVSDLEKHFPDLFADICIPKVFDEELFFSSVFRITSPGLQLWTHYDTCHNILIQVRGRKRVVFYPPSEALNLYLDGDKSEVLDIDSPDLEAFPKFALATRYETFLDEGDIVFIPALWFHNITALDFSISVNVFWKNLPLDLYDKKDTYGNKDFIPAQLPFTTGQFLLPARVPDNSTCSGITSNLFKRQLRRISTCTRQLNLKGGHHCVLKCAMIMEGVLSKEGKIDQKLLDQFVDRFPDFLQQRVIQYIERCRVVAAGKLDHKEKSCKSYEPLSRCITDAVFNGFRTLDKAAGQLKNLPPTYEDFYLRRMIISLENRLSKISALAPRDNNVHNEQD
ncbi:unnamed protein product [Allacma fusca]|uniref:JmjC domain-containing protein n=1 Tax=Allacma fusca TaxID=39272 RepID=A0A8J2PL38_9HEXA|nr:unnamed protein product [Allacma fusca]